MNVIAYLKSSNDEDNLDIDTQFKIIQDYCTKNQLTILQQISSDDEFDEILFGSINSQSFNAVIVVNSGYIAKDVNIYFYYKACLLKKNIRLISVQDRFEQFKERADILESFISCMVQMERDNLMKRTSIGRTSKAAAGGYSGGNAPMGYKVENGKLIINEKEAEVVKYIFARKAAGFSMLSTVNALNAEGFTTRKGKPFVISTVQSIWNNELTYRGMYHYGKDGEWVKGEHEAILKDDE